VTTTTVQSDLKVREQILHVVYSGNSQSIIHFFYHEILS
jgi:hypothetical protein